MPVHPRMVTDKIKFDYSHGLRDHTQKVLEGVQGILTHVQSPHPNIDGMLSEAANLISRQFAIDNVAIGLRDPEDGLYKYRAMTGFRDDAMEAHRRIAYKKEEFGDDEKYHGVVISKFTRVYLAEENIPSDTERGTYNRPGLFTMNRKDPTDSLEGDYIDIGIYGKGDDLLGWIEISGTRMMKLPDAATIRWVEVIASIIAAAMICSKAR